MYLRVSLLLKVALLLSWCSSCCSNDFVLWLLTQQIASSSTRWWHSDHWSLLCPRARIVGEGRVQRARTRRQFRSATGVLMQSFLSTCYQTMMSDLREEQKENLNVSARDETLYQGWRRNWRRSERRTKQNNGKTQNISSWGLVNGKCMTISHQ